ncbi:MAG: hypothetical protein EHM91_14610 [Planctomycetota bacterium]|nr:MAG: hypothetical protein EHM91_14610 [Planctomycetota bacterium]
MPSINNIKLTIGGPEAPSGTAAAMEHVVPIQDPIGLDKTAESQQDPAILGLGMAAGEYTVC